MTSEVSCRWNVWLAILKICCTRSPRCMLQLIRQHIHRRLENDVKALRFKPFQSITEYFMAHRVLCRKMYQAGYHNIAYVLTTIRFILNALNGNPKCRDAARSLWLAGLLENLGILKDRLLEEEASLHEKSTFNIYAPEAVSNRGRGRGYRWRGDHGDGIQCQMQK